MKTMIRGACATLLLFIGMFFGFFAFIARVDSLEEETVLLRYDFIIGFILGGAVLFGVMAPPSELFRSARRQMGIAVVSGIAAVIVVAGGLYWWQQSVMEARHQAAMQIIEQSRQENGVGETQPTSSTTNSIPTAQILHE
jgi:hypothetical protein